MWDSSVGDDKVFFFKVLYMWSCIQCFFIKKHDLWIVNMITNLKYTLCVFQSCQVNSKSQLSMKFFCQCSQWLNSLFSSCLINTYHLTSCTRTIDLCMKSCVIIIYVSWSVHKHLYLKMIISYAYMFPLRFIKGIATFHDDISSESMNCRVFFEIQVVRYFSYKPRYACFIYH